MELIDIRHAIESITSEQAVRNALTRLLSSSRPEDLLTNDEALFSKVLSAGSRIDFSPHVQSQVEAANHPPEILYWTEQTARLNGYFSLAENSKNILIQEFEARKTEITFLTALQKELQGYVLQDASGLQVVRNGLSCDLDQSEAVRQGVNSQIDTGEIAIGAHCRQLSSLHDRLVAADEQGRHYMESSKDLDMLNKVLHDIQTRSIHSELDVCYLQSLDASEVELDVSHTEQQGVEDWRTITADILSQLPIVLHLHIRKTIVGPYVRVCKYQALRLRDSCKTIRGVIQDIVHRQQAGVLVTKELRNFQCNAEQNHALLANDLVVYTIERHQKRCMDDTHVQVPRRISLSSKSSVLMPRKHVDTTLLGDVMRDHKSIIAEV